MKYMGIIREVIQTLRSNKYSRKHRLQAKAALITLEKYFGVLPKSIKKECDDYALDVLGHKKYAPWLYVYSLIQGKFKHGWIPDNYYGEIVVPNVNGSYGKLSELKSLNKNFFLCNSFNDICYFVNGCFIDVDKNVLTPDNVKDNIFSVTDKVVFKLDNSIKGHGIYIFTKEDFKQDTIKKLGNGLFQPFIEQHKTFNEFVPSSVATLRLTTTLDDRGQVDIVGCYLRLSSGDDDFVHAGRTIRVPVDLVTGEFGIYGFDPDWNVLEKHPYSNKTFKGSLIPAFDKCVDLVKTTHLQYPFARCVGWDVAIGSDLQLFIMEWNGAHNDIKFTEALQGPCFNNLDWNSMHLREM